MFGKRSDSDTRVKPAIQAPEPASSAAVVPRETAAPAVASPPIAPAKAPPAPAMEARRSDVRDGRPARLRGGGRDVMPTVHGLWRPDVGLCSATLTKHDDTPRESLFGSKFLEQRRKE